MSRRDFMLLSGAAVMLPLAARAPQAAIPVVGYIRNASRVAVPFLEAAFRQGLGSMGFEDGRNVAIEYRYAEGQYTSGCRRWQLIWSAAKWP